MKKIAIAVGLLCIVTFTAVGIKNQQAVKLILDCRTVASDSTCFVDTIERTLHENPDQAAATMEQIATLRRIGLLGGDFRAYSFTLHHLGSMYFMNHTTFDTLGRHCPALVKDGCVHGYVMEYFAANGDSKTQALCQSTTQVRLRIGCFHAFGHSYTENTADSLLELRDVCQKATSQESYAACFSGVLHEYIRGGADSHDHSAYYTNATSLRSLDCTIFSQASLEYTLCYAAIGSFRQYNQYSESLETTKDLCLTAQNASAKQVCVEMINERRMIARGYSFIPN